MAGNTRNERGQEREDLAAAARDRGMEQLENAKGRWADSADRVAAAVDRTADELEGEGGDATISGFGHSVATLMRQLSGGLRERDVDDFARELGSLARRNPGMFLAGSVALGFGVARFFKARTPATGYDSDDWARSDGAWREASGETVTAPRDFDGEENLDLSAGSEQRAESNELHDDITSGGKS
jgi:hypothetical protein